MKKLNFRPYWQVTVGVDNPWVIAQFAERWDAEFYMKNVRKHYSTGAVLTASYLGQKGKVNPPEDIVMKGTRRSL